VQERHTRKSKNKRQTSNSKGREEEELAIDNWQWAKNTKPVVVGCFICCLFRIIYQFAYCFFQLAGKKEGR
jgi:hypothetical protein